MTNTFTTLIPVPQSPCVDLRTGFPTREWYLYWQQPELQNISFTGQISVANGGTGIAGGVSGGVLAFSSTSSIVSSGLLGKAQIVFGGGPGEAPSTPLGTGNHRSFLTGNTTGYPAWYALQNSPSIRWVWDDNAKTVTPYLNATYSLRGIDSVVVTGVPSQGTTTIALVNDAATPPKTSYYGTNNAGTLGYNTIASALIAGSNITLTTGSDNRVTVASAASGNGVLPVVTGGVQNAQPTFVYFDDGSLMYAEAA